MTKLIEIKPEMMDRIQAMLQNTWAAIAGDWLDMHRNVIETSCTVESAAEGMADAERYLAYGEDKEAALVYQALSWDDMKLIAIDVATEYADAMGVIT